MWDKINVWQYQQIYNALNTKEKDATDLDLEVKLVGIVNNMTEMQIDSLPLTEYKELGKTIAFLNEPIEGTPKKHITISYNKRYKINYDISKMPFARYIESKVFSEDLYGNLHKLAATMVIPQKRKFGIWFNEKYDASKHQEYANDMLEAKFVDVYHSLVFFLSSIQKLDRSFTGLFGEENDGSRDGGSTGDRGGSKFMHYFGWQYSTKLIAEYENCRVSEAYELSTIECLNILSYLKSKTDYDNEQIKKVR